MAALTRKRNRKTRKQQQRRRIKKHTTRRLKGRLLRTRVKKNKTRKLQRGGLNDNDTLFKRIDVIKAIPEYTAFIKKYETNFKKISIKDKLDELNELKKSNKVYDKNMLNALNSAMINKIINDIFKLNQCKATNCFDDDVLAALLLDEENLLYDPLKYPSGIPLYSNFLRTEVELEKINAAKESFTTYYNNNNKVTNEHKINKRKKFILVLLSTATNISRNNKVKLDKKVKEEKDAVPFFKTEFQDMLTHLQNDNNLFEVPLGDPTEEEIQKTGNADSFGINKTDNTAKALAGLPEEGATPSEEEEEINEELFNSQEPLYYLGTNVKEQT